MLLKTCQQYNKYNYSDHERDKIDIKIYICICLFKHHVDIIP